MENYGGQHKKNKNNHHKFSHIKRHPPHSRTKIPTLCSDSAHLNSNFAETDNRSIMKGIVKMRDIRFDKSLFINYMTGTVLDQLLCSYQGLPKGVNYMIIGDPGVGKTTIILDMIANIQLSHPDIHILFISAEMNEIDLAIYVQRYPKVADLNIMFVEAEFNAEAHYFQAHNPITTSSRNNGIAL